MKNIITEANLNRLTDTELIHKYVELSEQINKLKKDLKEDEEIEELKAQAKQLEQSRYKEDIGIMGKQLKGIQFLVKTRNLVIKE